MRRVLKYGLAGGAAYGTVWTYISLNHGRKCYQERRSGCSSGESKMTSFYHACVRPLAFRLPPEDAHTLTLYALMAGSLFSQWHSLLGSRSVSDLPASPLTQRIAGIEFKTPIGIAAGFDKSAGTPGILNTVGGSFGLSSIEVGSISALPSGGNSFGCPKIHRLEKDESVINFLGLPNEGADAVAATMQRYREVHGYQGLKVGVNICKTNNPLVKDGIQDYVYTFGKLYEYADYFTVNVSCPNTASARFDEDVSSFRELLSAISQKRGEFSRKVPVFVKLAPTENAADLAALVLAEGFEGVVLGNTVNDRNLGFADDETASRARSLPGGVSGPLIRSRSTEILRQVYQRTQGQLVIVGAGGVDSPEAAYEKIRNGASLVQLYTALIYHGPGIIEDINTGLCRLLEADSLSLSQAIGIDARS